MSRYLNSTHRDHWISHILADDNKSALCVWDKDNLVWPRVSDEWIAGDEPTQALCHNCSNRKRRLEAIPQVRKTRLEKREEAERAKLKKWVADAEEFYTVMLNGTRDCES